MATPSQYSGGDYIFNYNDPQSSFDLTFTVTQVPPTPIPTLPEWALGGFGALIAGFGLVMVNLKRQKDLFPA